MSFSVPHSWSEARQCLVPVIRPATRPINLWRAARAPGRALLRTPLAPGLHLLVAVDGPGVRIFLTQGHLTQWGVDAERVFSIARDNLDPIQGIRRRDDGIWEINAPDGLASSRLALPNWLKAFEGKVEGSPLCALPCSRRLLVGGTQEAARLYADAEVLFRGEGEPISPCLYTQEGQNLSPYIGPSTELRQLATNAERWQLGHLYGDLADLLKEAGETLEPYRLWRRQGRCISFCNLRLGVWLPKVDILLWEGKEIPYTFLSRIATWQRSYESDPPCTQISPDIPATALALLTTQL